METLEAAITRLKASLPAVTAGKLLHPPKICCWLKRVLIIEIKASNCPF